MLEKLKKYFLEDQKNKKILITVAWVGAVFLILIIVAMTGDGVDAAATADFNIVNMVFGTLIRLVLVLALIYGLFAIYRLFQKNGQNVHERRLQIVDTHRFSSKQAVVLMRVDQREILLGLTDHQITLLQDIGSTGGVDLSNADEIAQEKSFKEYMEAQDEQ